MKSITEHINDVNETSVNNEIMNESYFAEITANMSKGELEYFVGMIIGGVGTIGTLTAAYITRQIAKSKLKKETVQAITKAVNEGFVVEN